MEFIPPFLSTLKLLILTSLYISTLCSQNCTFTLKFNFSLLQGRVNDSGFSNSLQQFLFLYLYFASMPLMQHSSFSKLESFFIFFKNGRHPKWYPMYPTIVECYYIYRTVLKGRWKFCFYRSLCWYLPWNGKWNNSR